MFSKIIIGLCLSLIGLSATAQDFGIDRVPKASATSEYKYIDEMKPAELENALNGYARCKIHSANKDFPFQVDFVNFNGPDGKLFFLEVSKPKTQKVIKILHLEEVAADATTYQVKADQRTLGFGWLAKAALSFTSNNEIDVLITELSTKWQIGYSLGNVRTTCPGSSNL